MASIPENVRILWPSSATTPSGWTTDTAFNDVMPYSANSGSGTGGANTHSHSGNSHGHPGGSHSHSTGTLNAPSPTQGYYYSGGSPPLGWKYWQTGGSGKGAAHTHPGSSLGSANTGSASGSNGNYNSQSSLPAYYTFRVIKSDGTGDGFPANSVVLWGTASNPTTQSGWSQHSGSVGKFIRGASNGGSTGGGGSHSHASNSNHTHGGGGGGHTHSGGNVTSSSGPCAGLGGGCDEGTNRCDIYPNHAHSTPSASSASAGGGANAAGAGSSGGTTLEPTYISVWGVTNSSDSWLEGGIGFISGESLPEDWVLCNGSNSTPNLNASKYIKLSSSGGAVSGTGGSTSHNHSGPGGHSHPAGGGSHSHPLSSSTSGTRPFHGQFGSNHGIKWEVAGPPRGDIVMCPVGHNHPMSGTNASNTGGYGSGSQGIAAASFAPSYKTVNWIMAPEEPSAGGNMAMFGANF